MCANNIIAQTEFHVINGKVNSNMAGIELREREAKEPNVPGIVTYSQDTLRQNTKNSQAC